VASVGSKRRRRDHVASAARNVPGIYRASNATDANPGCTSSARRCRSGNTTVFQATTLGNFSAGTARVIRRVDTERVDITNEPLSRGSSRIHPI